jgi:hypothetical protein
MMPKHKPARWDEWKDIEIPKTYKGYSDDRLLAAYVKQKGMIQYASIRGWMTPKTLRYFRLRRELHYRLTGE